MARKYGFIDFEYNHSQDKKLNLVCCSIYVPNEGITNYWLHNDPQEQEHLRALLVEMDKDGYIFVAHYVAAEAHAFISLDLDPILFKWIDTRTEFRCITNHSDIMYGKHLIEGKVKYTSRPDYYETAKVNNSKPESNLGAMIYKMIGKIIDTEHKTEMRDLIISAPKFFTPQEKEDILKYCDSDVQYLEPCLSAIVKKYQKLFSAKPRLIDCLLDEMLLRGQFGADTARIYSTGYPIDYLATVNFSESVEDILSDLARDINKQFPTAKPFRYCVKDKRFKMSTKIVRGWIDQSKYKRRWKATPTKLHSLSLEAFEKFFKDSHNYPRGNYGSQMLRFLKTKQAMNGFRPSLSGKKSFWDSVGSDQRVRPFLNPYGAATSRSQPSATGFIPLKAAWMRSLIMPMIGRAMCELDYGSQEYLIAALLSRDWVMVESYKTGDVYLAFAILAGLVPPNATKKSHPKERQYAKSAVLAISYSMTGRGLADTLSQKTDKDWTTGEAQELIDKFHEIYHKYAAWKEEQIELYKEQGFLKLRDGWFTWGENPNKRSVNNFPVQGAASDILRRACNLAHKKGLDVTHLLHDAAYIEYDSFDYKKIDELEDCLRKAFTDYFDEDIKEYAKVIRIGGTTWSPDYKYGQITTPKGFEIGTEQIHIDERTVDSYEKFSPYFKREKKWDLL